MFANCYPPPKSNEPSRFGLKTRLISMVLTVAMVFTFLPTAAFAADGDVVINETNFPDEVFRDYVSENFDTDDNGSLSADEIAAVTKIVVGSEGIRSLKGIERFPALRALYCDNNQLTELDVSHNIALTDLGCHHNELIELDVSCNTALAWLNCSYNELSELNVSNNADLTKLYCSCNQLTKLDVSNNTALTELYCTSNQLTELDVSGDTALTELYCDYNELSKLNVDNNTALTYLSCYGNRLAELNVSNNTSLTHLNCANNELSELGISNNTALIELACHSNQLTKLDVSGNTALTTLSCYENQLTELSVNTALTDLDCSNNQLTELDVSKCAGLLNLDCEGNDLTTLNLGENVEFIALHFDIGKYPVSIKSCSFDLQPVHDLEIRKVHNVQNGYLKGTMLYVNEGSEEVSFDYEDITITLNLLPHTWDSGKVTKPSTATETGVMTYTCTVCGTTKTETIDKLPTPEADTYTITVYGGKAYSDAGYEHEITSAKDGDTVWIKADNRAFKGWVSEGNTHVTFDKSDATDTWFHMPAGNVVIRAAGDAEPASSGNSGGGAGIVLLGGVVVAIVGGAIAVVMMMPVTISGHVVHAENKAVIPNASIQLKQNGAVVATTTAAADGSFSLSAKVGEYDVVVTWTDEEGNTHTGTSRVKINAFGNTSGINVEV